MSLIRTLAILGVGYWLVRKLGKRSVPSEELDWEDAYVAPSKGKVAAGAAAKPAGPSGGNGAFGSHAPFGDGPKEVH
jgi:hypothetical protein